MGERILQLRQEIFQMKMEINSQYGLIPRPLVYKNFHKKYSELKTELKERLKFQALTKLREKKLMRVRFGLDK